LYRHPSYLQRRQSADLTRDWAVRERERLIGKYSGGTLGGGGARVRERDNNAEVLLEWEGREGRLGKRQRISTALSVAPENTQTATPTTSSATSAASGNATGPSLPVGMVPLFNFEKDLFVLPFKNSAKVALTPDSQRIFRSSGCWRATSVHERNSRHRVRPSL
jgi:hypothetical protein